MRLLLVCLLLIAIKGHSQFNRYYADASTTYSFVNELGKKFLGFSPSTDNVNNIVAQLLSDSTLRIDTTIFSSDTSRFYLRGYHKNFNPFQIPLDTVRTILSEQRIPNSSNKKIIDTLLYFQIEGIAVGQKHIENLQPAFKKLDLNVRSSFFSSYYNKTKTKKDWIGEGLTYYVSDEPIPLLNITWRKRNENVAIICMTFYTLLY